MCARPPKDIVIRDKLYRTSAGWRSREGLALGYSDRRGTYERGVVLQEGPFETTNSFMVRGSGELLTQDYYQGHSLGAARRAFAAVSLGQA